MKMKKLFKNYILAFVLSIISLFIISNDNIGAIGYNVKSSQDRIQNSYYVFDYNGTPYYSYGGVNLRYNNSTDTWESFGGNTSINGQYVQQIGDTLYYFGGSSSRLYKINPTTDTAWTTFTTSNYNYYGDYMYWIGDNLYFSNNSTHAVLNPSDMSWSAVTWTGSVTQFYGNSVFTWNNNLYYINGAEIYKKVEGVLEWQLLNGTLGATFSGVDTWQYNGDLYYTNYNNSSVNGLTAFTPTYKFNTTTNSFEVVELTGSHRFGGRMVYYANNKPQFAYYYSIYELDYVAVGNISEEDLENAYNEGFNEGNNNLLRVTGCEIVSIENQSPSAFGYTSDCEINRNGNIYNAYDNINNIVNLDNLTRELITYSDIEIKFYVVKNPYFSGQLMFYTKEQTGARISLYNNDVLVETHLVQALNGITYSFYPITMDIQFNSIVIEYEDYYVAPHEFGLIQTNTYAPISEYNYNRGYNVGYTAGNGSGNNIAGIIGAIFVGPINMLSTIFDFEFLGINLAGFILSLTTLLVVIWLIKRFI